MERKLKVCIEAYNRSNLSTPYTLTPVDGAHGTADNHALLYTNDYGVVPTLPTATPNEGYEFEGWVDSRGYEIIKGDVIQSSTTITPVFIKSPNTP